MLRAMQVNVHPNDVGHLPVLLPHQIRTWGPQVDRVHVTLALHASRAGHYVSPDFERKLAATRAALDAITAEHPKVVVDEVDASAPTRRKVAQACFGLDDMPMKAWNGSPLYAYLFGIWKAQADYVVHFDGDMFFGGGSRTWLDEAVAVLDANPDCGFVGPLPGPPRPDGSLEGHGANWRGVEVRRMAAETPTYRFNTVSTRIFVTGLDLLRRRMGGPLQARRPALKERTHARLLGNPPRMIELERILSENLAANGLCRIDFLGSGPGTWSLHPPLRSPEFFARLPELVSRVETNDLPDDQRGRYDMVDALIDFSAARRGNTRQARWRRHAGAILARLRPA